MKTTERIIKYIYKTRQFYLRCINGKHLYLNESILTGIYCYIPLIMAKDRFSPLSELLILFVYLPWNWLEEAINVLANYLLLPSSTKKHFPEEHRKWVNKFTQKSYVVFDSRWCIIKL